MGAGAERRGSRHLVGRERLGEGGRGRQAGEVGRDLTDGADGSRTHIDGHVLLDGDGQTFSFSHSHRATAEDWSHKKRKKINDLIDLKKNPLECWMALFSSFVLMIHVC